jgi:hypothetical protein
LLQNEYSWAISKLLFLEARKGNSASGCANLVSCGGNGIVRFWNSSHNTLMAEFTAHQHGMLSYFSLTFKELEMFSTNAVINSYQGVYVAEWLRSLTSNHLPLTAVGSNPNRDIGFFYVRKLSS